MLFVVNLEELLRAYLSLGTQHINLFSQGSKQKSLQTGYYYTVESLFPLINFRHCHGPVYVYIF